MVGQAIEKPPFPPAGFLGTTVETTVKISTPWLIMALLSRYSGFSAYWN